jgi:hypothetical protein
VLPDWSPPSGHYSVHCRQQAWELLQQADGTWERSIPSRKRRLSDGPSASIVGRGPQANGPAVVAMLQTEISGLIAVNPEGGKISRLKREG